MKHLYILRYTLQGFELAKQEIISTEELSKLPIEEIEYSVLPNSGFITYRLDSGRTNIVRENKLNRVHMFGEFSYVAYFTDPKRYSRIKAEMCDKIDLSIRKQESMLNQNKKQYKEFLYSKLGENL